ncbi:MAG: hypothetical protein ABWY52_02135 [Candidatus Limnocylindrales bacterium]
MPSHAIHVRCQARDEGWRCLVRVGDHPGATQHEVIVTSSDLARIAPPDTSVEALVEASFAFLLAREPPESILRSFELPIIGSYFPGYEADVRHRLAP